MRAILSVYDKTGLVEFAQGLADLGVELFSTGGTKRALEEGGVSVRGIEELTGFPEILDGRVKTLHPAVHGGLLARRDLPDHQAQLQRHGLGYIDLVAVNLYPFVATISKPAVSLPTLPGRPGRLASPLASDSPSESESSTGQAGLEDALENIDIGGPTMLRAAAKNYPSVLVVSDPEDYVAVLNALRDEKVDQTFRRALAAKAFQHVAFYDTVIAQYLRDPQDLFPQELTLAFQRQQVLRYGENPHQQGALYREPLVGYSSLVVGQQALGQQLSLCNLNDLSAALETVRDFLGRPAAAVIKHATPSGFAFGSTLAQALEKAIHADATSAFGGIIGLNQELDLETARVIAAFKEQESSNIDAIVAPGVAEAAIEVLRKTRRRMILYTVPTLDPLPSASKNLKNIPGGILYQEANVRPVDTSGWKDVTKVAATEEQRRAMKDAWTLLRRIRSNTILVWDGVEGVTLGIGSGQTSRVGAAKLALEQAGERARGAILASDSFFPFQDTVELAAQYGIGAIVQQGGSINDKASIEAADAAGIPMVLTGERAFWH